MKLIFLDIDGVLNSEQSQCMYYHHKAWLESKLGKGSKTRELCPISISNLDYLMREVPDAKVVISSSWRIGETLESLKEILKEQKVQQTEKIIGLTPVFNINGKRRGLEIEAFLKAQKEHVESFVILDDDSDMEPYMDRLILTHWRDGLVRSKTIEALHLLNTGVTI